MAAPVATEHPSWVMFRNTAFDQSHVVREGPMSEAEARKVVESNLGECLGFSSHVSNPDYRWVVQRGSLSMPSQPGWTVMVYKVSLPKTGQFFDDGFAGTSVSLGSAAGACNGWGRPGRGQGVGDLLPHLGMVKSVDPSDLRQGGLGDCWLVSSFAAVCEFPHHLLKIMEPKTLAIDGKYTIMLHDYSKRTPVPVVVDDRVPRGNNDKPAFTDITEDGEIWPCILEKAFAKLAGSYENLDGGDPLFALGLLSGCHDLVQYRQGPDGMWQLIKPQFNSSNPRDPSNQYQYGQWANGESGTKGRPPSEIIKLLGEAESKNYLMCAGSHAGSDKDISEFGIVQGHAYTLISVVLNVAGSGKNLLELRNPWGTGEWKGAWSDDSSEWNQLPAVKAALKPQFADDGTFWIEDSDFFANYSQVVVAQKDMGGNRKKVAAQGTTLGAARPENIPTLMGVPKGQNAKMDQRRKQERLEQARRARRKARGLFSIFPDLFNVPVSLQTPVDQPALGPHEADFPMDVFMQRYYGDPPQTPYGPKFKADPKAWYELSLQVSLPDPNSKKRTRQKVKV